MKKKLLIFCIVILGVFFINSNCLAFSVSEVIYKKFETRGWTDKKIVIVKLILYSESISITNKEEINEFNNYKKLIEKATNYYSLKGWVKNNNPNFSNFVVKTESIEFFINTNRKHDVIWGYLWACDSSKLFNKTKYRPKIETFNEFFDRTLKKTEEEIKRKYDLK